MTHYQAFRAARSIASFVATKNPQLLEIAQKLVRGIDPIQFKRNGRSIYLWGRQYFLSGDQSVCMWHLVQAYKAKTPEVSSSYLETIINPGKSSFKLAHIWRDHPLWGTRIRPGRTKGSVMLVPPKEFRKTSKRTATTHEAHT